MEDNKKKLGFAIAIDIIMVALMLININLIIFDSFFSVKLIAATFQKYLPGFYTFYQTNIHAHFALIDLCFVAVFFTEFVVRWVLSSIKHGKEQIFLFPLLYWYDGLGCVPIAGFRWLRLLRIFSLLVRLQKSGLINVKKFFVFSLFKRFTDIVVEEISDRVIVKTLEGVKAEVKKGNPLTDQIIKDVLKPQSKEVVKWLSGRIQLVSSNIYRHRREDIKKYVDSRLKDAVLQNKEVKLLGKIPVVGGQINTMLESAIRDIVFSVIDSLFVDLQENNQVLSEELAHISNDMFTLIENDNQLDGIIENIINQSIDIIIKQVEIKEWKVEEAN